MKDTKLIIEDVFRPSTFRKFAETLEETEKETNEWGKISIIVIAILVIGLIAYNGLAIYIQNRTQAQQYPSSSGLQ